MRCMQVLTAFNGGRITMYGRRVAKRWLKLAAAAVRLALQCIALVCMCN